ncbi:MAG: UDP-N-acetylmuramate--L-alanine ligase [Patescibacteria group bacterium]|jgi:UDP-N-acetylmuramate--alanine ligase
MNKNIKHVVHCIGIGGIGLSGLARLLHEAGHSVSGSDVADSEMVQRLMKEGIKVRIGMHASTHLPANVQMVVMTAATQSDNPELLEAKRRSIPVMLYAEALAAFMDEKQLIAVSGTHGKSTTTGLIGWGLEKLHADPTILIGSQVRAWDGNIRIGASNLALVEADEYNRSFLAYRPFGAVITNVDYDHVDTYSGLEDVLAAFIQFIGQVHEDGFVVLPEGEHYTDALKAAAGSRTVITFGDTQGDLNLLNTEIKLKIPGAHNQRNGLAALAALAALGHDMDAARKVLRTFPGLWRRFEEIGAFKDARIFSDYAHHPHEVHAVLQTAREVFPKKKLVVVFQPHHALRTKHFLNDFARELKVADELYLTDIYHVAGREQDAIDIDIHTLADTVRSIGGNVQADVSLEELAPFLTKAIDRSTVVFFLGAGDIDAFARKFIHIPS